MAKLSSCKFKFGGMPRTKMVAGAPVKRGDQSSTMVRKALASKGAMPSNNDADGGEVTGSAPKMRLDRPMRASGGRIKRADGGGVQDYLKDRASDKRASRNFNAGAAGITGVATILDPDPISKAMLGAMSLGNGAMAKMHHDDAKKMMGAADKFSKTGLPELPDREERKSGGRVHSDAKEDKSLVASMIHKHEAEDHKGSPMTKFARGGHAKKKD